MATLNTSKRIGAAAAGILFLTSGLMGAGLAWADPTYEKGTIQIDQATSQPSDVKYDVFQIFKAQVDSGKATEIAWTSAAMETAVNNAIKADAGTYNATEAAAELERATAAGETPKFVEGDQKYTGTTAQDALDYISEHFPSGTNPIPTADDFAEDLAKAIKAAGIAATATLENDADASNAHKAELDEGYVLVLSKSGYTTATSPIFQPIENNAPVKITEKTSVPTLTKQVKEDSVTPSAATQDTYEADQTGTLFKWTKDGEAPVYSDTTPGDGWTQDGDTTYKLVPGHDAVDGFQSTNDAEYGEACDFRMVGTLPSNYATYDVYQYTFTDTLASSLDLVTAGDTFSAANDIHVFIGDTEVKTGFTATYNNHVLTVSFTDLNNCKANANDANPVAVSADDTVKVTYQAKLNDTGVIGAQGNENKATLTYSNDPQGTDTGTTNEVKTHTYAYQLNILKTDKNSDEPVGGVTFTLLGSDGTTAVKLSGSNGDYKVDPSVTTSAVLTTKDDGTLSIKGLDEGVYYIQEASVPSDFAIINNAFKIQLDSALKNDAYDATETPATRTFKVSISEGKAEYSSITAVSAANGTGDAKILNDKKSDLPATGQNIALFSMIAGAVLIGGGIVIGLRRSRKNSELDDE